jgi:hypothetical protein
MQRNFLILLCLFFLLILPEVVLADCISVGYVDNFIVKDDTIILYNGQVPFVKIVVNCNVDSTSKIRLLKSYLCDGDDILIDGSTCRIISLVRANED